MADIKTIAANMAHAARNRETVTIGGGLFNAASMARLAARLTKCAKHGGGGKA